MKLTPEMIREQRFKVKLSGFDKNEVIAFLMDMAEDMEMLIEENSILKSEVETVRRRQKDLEDLFLSVKQFSDEKMKRVDLDANAILAAAEKKASDIQLAANQKLVEAEQRAQELHTQVTLKAREVLREAERSKIEIERGLADLKNKRTTLFTELKCGFVIYSFSVLLKVPLLFVSSYLYSIHEKGYKYNFSPFPKSPDCAKAVFDILDSIPAAQKPKKVAIFMEKAPVGMELRRHVDKGVCQARLRATPL